TTRIRVKRWRAEQAQKRAEMANVTHTSAPKTGLSSIVFPTAAASATEAAVSAVMETCDEQAEQRYLDGDLAGATRHPSGGDGAVVRDDPEGPAVDRAGTPASDGDAAGGSRAVAGPASSRCA